MKRVISLSEYRAKKNGYIKIEKILKRYPLALNSLIGKTDNGLYVALHSEYPLNDMMVWPKPSKGHLVKITPDLKTACQYLKWFHRKERKRNKSIRDAVYKAYYGEDVGFMMNGKVKMLDFVSHEMPYANHVVAYDLETFEGHMILDGHNLERLVKYFAEQFVQPVTVITEECIEEI